MKSEYHEGKKAREEFERTMAALFQGKQIRTGKET